MNIAISTLLAKKSLSFELIGLNVFFQNKKNYKKIVVLLLEDSVGHYYQSVKSWDMEIEENWKYDMINYEYIVNLLYEIGVHDI